MRRWSLVGVTAGAIFALAAVAACSLTTSLDGFAGGSPDTPADSAVGEASMTNMDASDASALDADDARPIADAGVTDDAGPNIHPQGTFETGMVDPWGSYNGTAAVSPIAHTGSFSCRVCISPSLSGDFTGDDNGAPGPPILGATYRARVWVRSDPNAPPPTMVGLALRHAEASPMFVSLEANGSPEVVLTSTWQRLEVTLTITKPGGYLNVFLGGPSVPNACFLFDDVVVQRVP